MISIRIISSGSIEGRPVGTQTTAGDLQLPEGSTLSGLDPEALIVNLTAAPTAAQIDAELAEAEAEVGIEPTLADDTEGNEAPEQPESDDADAEGAANA